MRSEEVASLGEDEIGHLIGLADSSYLKFVAKLFAGLAIGAIQCLTPTYIAECSPVRIRGVLLFTYDIWFSVGGLIAAIALQVMNDHDPYNWRIPIYTQWGLIAAMAIVYLLIPESPCMYPLCSPPLVLWPTFVSQRHVAESHSPSLVCQRQQRSFRAKSTREVECRRARL